MEDGETKEVVVLTTAKGARKDKQGKESKWATKVPALHEAVLKGRLKPGALQRRIPTLLSASKEAKRK